MAAIVPAEDFDPAGLAQWVQEQPDAATTWVPRYLRVTPDLPRTATGKVIVRKLAQQAWHGTDVWIRDGEVMRPMTEVDRFELAAAFAASGRQPPLVS